MARSRTSAVGSEGATRGVIGGSVDLGDPDGAFQFGFERSDHSGQFYRNIQESMRLFYREILRSMEIPLNP